MSALARIRKTALQHEQERQYDKALALYARLLDGAEAGEEEVDVALFNRAGDLALRTGDTPRALGYFERALDLYAAGGLLNNAVALGVKILRHAPAHLSAHYTLGVLYGRKGFAGDARHHLLTYAVQMQRAGRADEAARVLGEVAAACLDAGERRAALDAYGALGGDPAQAAALADAIPAPAAAPTAEAAPAVAAPAPVVWGAVDFDVAPELPSAAPADAAPVDAWADPLVLDDVTFDEVDFNEVAIDGGIFNAADFGLPAATGAPEPLPLVTVDTPAWTPLTLEPLVFDAPAEPPAAHHDSDAPPPAALPFLELDTAERSDDDAGTSLVFLELPEDDMVAATPSAAAALSDAFADEPPPLRLAELLRLELGSSVDLPAVAPAPWPALTAVPVAAGADAVPALFPDPALADAYDIALELPPVRLADHLAASTPASAPVAEAPARPDPLAAQAVVADDDLLDLGAWLRETEEPATTRLTTASVPQTGDEQADFDAALREFTAGVSRAVEVEDWDSHYDLGVAFREMGLVDEAIVEFQRAARAPGRPLRALEALAQCFLDVGQPEFARSTLAGPVEAAAAAGTGDAALVAVHYLLGAAAQALGRPDDARRWFVRVVATDVRFRDAATRLAALPPPSPVR